MSSATLSSCVGGPDEASMSGGEPLTRESHKRQRNPEAWKKQTQTALKHRKGVHNKLKRYRKYLIGLHCIVSHQKGKCHSVVIPTCT